MLQIWEGGVFPLTLKILLKAEPHAGHVGFQHLHLFFSVSGRHSIAADAVASLIRISYGRHVTAGVAIFSVYNSERTFFAWTPSWAELKPYREAPLNSYRIRFLAAEACYTLYVYVAASKCTRRFSSYGVY